LPCSLHTYVGVKYLADNIAGLFAKCREEGTKPEHQAINEKMVLTATKNAYLKTEFHYAFQLIDLLANIRKRTFIFAAPPIEGLASPATLRYLSEATKFHFYRLHLACIALCRACLEETLKSRINTAAFLKARKTNPKQGDWSFLSTFPSAQGF
jgi:hypothetical protein